LSEID